MKPDEIVGEPLDPIAAALAERNDEWICPTDEGALFINMKALARIAREVTDAERALGASEWWGRSD